MEKLGIKYVGTKEAFDKGQGPHRIVEQFTDDDHHHDHDHDKDDGGSSENEDHKALLQERRRKR
jgi:hypothetical protein